MLVAGHRGQTVGASCEEDSRLFSTTQLLHAAADVNSIYFGYESTLEVSWGRVISRPTKIY